MFANLPGAMVLVILLALARASSQEDQLRVVFINVGQGHSTLILSPSGSAMLIDAGTDGMGDRQVVPLMHSLGVTRLDFMVASHYHLDHIGGLDEVARTFPPRVAYDRGSIAAPSSSTPYRQYVNAVSAARRVMAPGTTIDLGGGVYATCVVVAGKLLGGGEVRLFGRSDSFDQLENSASIGLLIQYRDFDLLIGGDLTGGGINTTDVETATAQLAGDVDVLQLNHHGSRTSSNGALLASIKAEVGIAQMGSTNDFLHPSIEVTDRFINSRPTSGEFPPPPDRNVAVLRVPFIVQNQLSPNSGSVSQQGLPAIGHIEITTNGFRYTIQGGVLEPITMATDGAEGGVRKDFPPTVVLRADPLVPPPGQPTSLFVQASDDLSSVPRLAIHYRIDGGTPRTLEVEPITEKEFIAVIPGQQEGARVELEVEATDDTGQSTVARYGYFCGITPSSRLRAGDPSGAPLYLGYPARISGRVTIGSGTLAAEDNEIYVQDETGGIRVVESGSRSRLVAPGDQVNVAGRIGQFSGETILDCTNPTTNYPFEASYGILLERSGIVPPPLIRQIRDVGEVTEGLLVRIDNLRISSGTIRPSGSSNLTVTDGTESVTLRIESATGIPGMPTPSQSFNLIGVISQFDSFRPFTRGYQILPRSRADFLSRLP